MILMFYVSFNQLYSQTQPETKFLIHQIVVMQDIAAVSIYALAAIDTANCSNKNIPTRIFRLIYC